MRRPLALALCLAQLGIASPSPASAGLRAIEAGGAGRAFEIPLAVKLPVMPAGRALWRPLPSGTFLTPGRLTQNPSALQPDTAGTALAFGSWTALGPARIETPALSRLDGLRPLLRGASAETLRRATSADAAGVGRVMWDEVQGPRTAPFSIFAGASALAKAEAPAFSLKGRNDKGAPPRKSAVESGPPRGGPDGQPGRFKRFLRRLPVITLALISLNTVVYGAEYAAFGGGNIPTGSLTAWGLVPDQVIAAFAHGPLGAVLHAVGTVFSCQFLHGSLSHLVGNMTALAMFGPVVEKAVGHGRALALYLGAGVAGALGALLVYSGADTVVVGASGAIAGLIGAVLVTPGFQGLWAMIRGAEKPTRRLLWLGFLLLNALVMVFSEFAAADQQWRGTLHDDVAHVSHVAGILAGVLIAAAFRLFHKPPPKTGS